MPWILMRAHPRAATHLPSVLSHLIYPHFPLRTVPSEIDPHLQCAIAMYTVVCVRPPVMYSQHYTQNTVGAFKIFPLRCCMHYWSEGFLILLSRSRRGGGTGGGKSQPNPTRKHEIYEDRALVHFRWARINTSCGRVGFGNVDKFLKKKKVNKC